MKSRASALYFTTLQNCTKDPSLRTSSRDLPYPDSLREKHTALANITPRTIAYPIRICLSRSLTKVSKPCYVIPTAYHNPCSAALRWCVRTPCPDIFAMDSKELSSISDCFGDQKAIKTPKLNTIWLELIARVLNILIGLKGDNYYSKVFKRVNYKLWNNTFWVVIIVLSSFCHRLYPIRTVMTTQYRFSCRLLLYDRPCHCLI